MKREADIFTVECRVAEECMQSDMETSAKTEVATPSGLLKIFQEAPAQHEIVSSCMFKGTLTVVASCSIST